jgi:serine/threonine protein phosphatase PrpC
MLIEAFSAAKDPSAPHTNEDQLVILPSRAYAVIDGVTDRHGSRYDGMLSGQYAAVTVKRALEHMLSARDAPSDGIAIVRALTETIADAYRAHGIAERARSETNLRFSAALALVLVQAETVDVILVGDSGVRINGERTLRVEKDLDLITSILRQQAWPVIGRKTSDPEKQEQLSRRVTWHGTRQHLDAVIDTLDKDDMSLIENHAIAANLEALPHVPRADIENLVRGGIVNAQGGYQNNASLQLGYPCLDGFEVPQHMIKIERVPRSEVQTVEIYSDGYFKPGDGFGVAAWEKAFAEAEREDPAKVLFYPSPKGSTASLWADDRTYLAVRF